jgi:tetratricopeptide (TPR) repeat protein
MSNATDKLLTQAFQARRENRSQDAKRSLIEAVRLCREAGVPADIAKALTSLGQIERDLHSGDVALQHYEEAAAIYRAEGDALKLAHTVRHLGDIHGEDGRAGLAERCYREALEIYRTHNQTPPLDLANCIRGFAILKDDAGEAAQARLLWEEAGELYAAASVNAAVAECRRRVALLDRPPKSAE